MNTQNVGLFFSINNSKYATELNYRSIKQFEKLIKNYTKNVYPCNVKNSEKLTYISIDSFLMSAYENLKSKPRAKKMIINLMALNKKK